MTRTFALCGLFVTALLACVAQSWFDLVAVLVAATILVTIFLLSYMSRDVLKIKLNHYLYGR